MALPTSGALSFDLLKTEFGDSNPVALNEFYAGGTRVPADTVGAFGAIPASGMLGLNKFYGSASSILSGAGWMQYPTSNPAPPAVVYGQGALLAGNFYISIAAPYSQTLASTNGGKTWVWKQPVYEAAAVTAGLTTIRIIGYINGVFYANGKASSGAIYVLTSSDAVNWTTAGTFGSAYISDAIVRFTVSGQQTFYVSNRAGPSLAASNKLLKYDGSIVSAGTLSSNHIVWFPGASGGVSQGGDGLLIVTGDYSLGAVPSTSANGIVWTARTVYNTAGSLENGGLSYSDAGNGLIFNNRFIEVRMASGVGSGSVRFLTTLDGINFTISDALPNSVATGSISYPPRIAASSTYVLCVYRNVSNVWAYAISTDGISWVEHNSLTLSGLGTINSLTYTNGAFKVVSAGVVYHVAS